MKEVSFTIFHDPQSIDFEDLGLLLKKYPWFSALHILWLLKIKTERPDDLRAELKDHIAYIRNRKHLYEILHANLWDELVEKSAIPSNHNNAVKDDLEELESELLEFSYHESFEYPGDDEVEDSQNTNSSDKDTLSEIDHDRSPELDEPTGFADWIEKVNNNGKNKIELIDRFLEAEPGPIRADKETNLKGDISRKSVEENEHFITDTLAKIYIKQGLYSKAIFAYEKLSLKYPEKSAYFAAQIEEIKSLTHNK